MNSGRERAVSGNKIQNCGSFVSGVEQRKRHHSGYRQLKDRQEHALSVDHSFIQNSSFLPKNKSKDIYPKVRQGKR